MRQQIVNHPWLFLAKELEERKISQVKFAQLIDITEAEVSNIIHGKKNIHQELHIVSNQHSELQHQSDWNDKMIMMYISWIKIKSKWKK